MLMVISGISSHSLLLFYVTKTVIAGLDPATHHLKDGYAGQARV
jgi:hypothetical protein